MWGMDHAAIAHVDADVAVPEHEVARLQAGPWRRRGTTPAGRTNRATSIRRPAPTPSSRGRSSRSSSGRRRRSSRACRVACTCTRARPTRHRSSGAGWPNLRRLRRRRLRRHHRYRRHHHRRMRRAAGSLRACTAELPVAASACLTCLLGLLHERRELTGHLRLHLLQRGLAFVELRFLRLIVSAAPARPAAVSGST